MTDYSAIAQEFGGKPKAPSVNYSALAKEFGGKPSAVPAVPARAMAEPQTVGDLVTQIPGAVNQLVRNMASGATGGRVNKWAAQLSALTGSGDYETNLASQNAMDEPSRRSGAAGAGEFIGAAAPAMIIARRGGLAMEAAAPVIGRVAPAVAPYLERAANAVKTAGFSLGEAAPTAPGIIAGTKNALINAGIRTGAGAGVNALAAEATAPNDVGTAAAVGGALPVVGIAARPIFALTGKAMDRIKSFGGERPAAQIIRDTLAEHFDPALAALRAAPNDGRTAVQVLADAGVPDVPAFAALANLTQKASPSTAFKALTDAQQKAQEQILTTLSGGATQTEARTAADAARAGVNRVTTPMREDVLGLTQEGNQIPLLEAEAAARRTAAEQAVEDVRRLHKATELATEQTRGIQAGETVGAAPRITYPPASPVDLNVQAQRGTTLAGVGEAAQDTAAAQSLARGRDARAAEAAAQAIRDKGLSPLKPDALVGDIENTLKDPTFAGDAPLEAALRSVASSVKKWTDNGMGTIDGNALYGIRKFAVSDAIRAAMPNAPESAVQGAMVRALVPINKAIDRAIEAASGNTGKWSNYLSKHTELMHGVEQQQLASMAQDLYSSGTPDGLKAFVKLVNGGNTDAVESVFGPGKFDIAEEMGAQYPALKKVADQVARDLKISVNATKGETAARNIVNDRTRGITQWPRIGKGLRASGSAQDLFDAALSRNTQKTLYSALQSGQSAAALLDKLSAAERAKLTGVFGGRTGLLRYLNDAFAGVSGATTAAASKTPEKREPLRLGITTQNAMSPPNQNAMAR